MNSVSLHKVITISALSVLFSSLGSRAYAINEYFSGGFPPASGTAGRILYQVPEASLGTQQYYTTYVKPGADAWNGITYKISISSNLSGTYNIRSKASTGSDPSVAGRTIPYCAAGIGTQCLNSQWNSAEVIGYNNVMDNSNFTATNKLQVWTHEFGHSLSLAHVTETLSATMWPNSPYNLGVQSRDRQNLIAKWGN